MIWFFDKDGEKLRYEITRDRVGGRYRVVITRPDRKGDTRFKSIASQIGCERPRSDRAGWRCLYGGITTGGGIAARFGSAHRALLFALFETDAGAGPAFAVAHNFRAGVGGEIGFVGQVAARWRFQLGGRDVIVVKQPDHQFLLHLEGGK